jgi:hypothetical protein
MNYSRINLNSGEIARGCLPKIKTRNMWWRVSIEKEYQKSEETKVPNGETMLCGAKNIKETLLNKVRVGKLQPGSTICKGLTMTRTNACYAILSTGGPSCSRFRSGSGNFKGIAQLKQQSARSARSTKIGKLHDRHRDCVCL